jgi:2-oxoglutarate-dependent dioxygenase
MSATSTGSLVEPMTLTDSEVRFYHEQGYLPLPGFLRADAVAALRDEVYEVLAANGIDRAALAHASGTADKLRQCSQYLAGSHLDELINGQSTLACAERLIGGRAVRYLPFTAVKAAGGGGTMHFHQDNNYTRHDPALGSINIWVALVDMTPENGCLQVMPGSHTRQHDAHESDDHDGHRQVDVDPLACVPIRMRAGDAVAFSRWTVHGSGRNDTDEPRVAYALQYHRDDVRWYDRETDSWRLLVDDPKFATPPVQRLGAD